MSAIDATDHPHHHDQVDLVDLVCRRAATVVGDVRAVVEREVARVAPLAPRTDQQRLVSRAVARLDGLDELDLYLGDPDVDEVMVNAGRDVWVDRSGALERVASLPAGVAEVVLERVLAPLGRRLDRTTPIVDARLPDGSRVCAVVAPIAIDGPTLAIRRHRRVVIPLERFGNRAGCALLAEIVARKCNVIVSGATSSGKTTLLSGLVGVARHDDRLVVIEDTAELPLPDRHAVRLEARAASIDGAAEVTLHDLVRTALRLRPDRLIVGEVRGSEVLALVQALNTGHDGSLSTCHANSAVDALTRLETLVMQAAPTWPLPAIRRHITRSVDVVVHVARTEGGVRQVVDIAEVVESGGDTQVRRLLSDGEVVGTLTRGRA